MWGSSATNDTGPETQLEPSLLHCYVLNPCPLCQGPLLRVMKKIISVLTSKTYYDLNNKTSKMQLHLLTLSLFSFYGHSHGRWTFRPGIESETQLQPTPQQRQHRILYPNAPGWGLKPHLCSNPSRWGFFNDFIFSIIADLPCSVNFLLYSKVTQSHTHMQSLLTSPSTRLHHK